MSLIERLEAAEAGSRELDADVHSALGTVFSRPVTQEDRYYSLLYDAKSVSVFIPEALTPVTTSLDAALALAERVLPGWDWKVGGLRPPIEGYDEREAPPHATLTRRGPLVANEGFAVADGATPALALCIAVLKATAALQAGQAGDFAKQNEPDTPPETGTGTGTEGGR